MDQPGNDNSPREFLQTALVGIPALSTIAVSQANQAGYQFFNHSEVAFLEPAVARLIPPDEKWPGARAAGVVTYIDRQMAGPWGRGEQLYMGGPFIPGTPIVGYQPGYTPADLFRRSIAAINQHLGTSFGRLSHEAQDACLRALEVGRFDLNGEPRRQMRLAERLKPVDVETVGVGMVGSILAKVLIGHPGCSRAGSACDQFG